MENWDFLFQPGNDRIKTELILSMKDDIERYLRNTLNIKLASLLLENKTPAVRQIIISIFSEKFDIRKNFRKNSGVCLICLEEINRTPSVYCKICRNHIYHIDCADVWCKNLHCSYCLKNFNSIE